MTLSYAAAGVRNADSDAFKGTLDTMLRPTHGADVLSSMAGFASLVAMPTGYQDPVLVASTDGVGTKCLLARDLRRVEGLGQDLVAMCVNDLLTVGARPLFFLDYIAVDSFDHDLVSSLVGSIAAACTEVGCALVGGETAQMPGVYRPGAFDLAGFVVGVVERARILDPAAVRPGDQIVAWPSSGVHANGYSLVRAVLDRAEVLRAADGDLRSAEVLRATDDDVRSADALRAADDDVRSAEVLRAADDQLLEQLLEPTRLYVNEAARARDLPGVRSAAHITGGGIVGNLPRALPPGLGCRLDRSSWTVPPIFETLQRMGDIEDDEMVRTFNMGLGFMVVADQEAAAELTDAGALLVGEVVEGAQDVRFE